MALEARLFRSKPRANPEVLAVADKLKQAAQDGYVQAILVVTVGPLNNAEVVASGDLSPVKSNGLLGGLVRAAFEVMKNL